MNIHILKPCIPYFRREFELPLEDESQINAPHSSQRCSTISAVNSSSCFDCNQCVTNRCSNNQVVKWIRVNDGNNIDVDMLAVNSQDTELEFKEEYFDYESNTYNGDIVV